MKIIIMENDRFSAQGLKSLLETWGVSQKNITVVASIQALNNMLSCTTFDRVITPIQSCEDNIGDWLGLLANAPDYFMQGKIVTWEPADSLKLKFLSNKTYFSPNNIDKHGKIDDISHQLSLFLTPKNTPLRDERASEKLTLIEMKTLSQLCSGKTPERISASANISVKTVSGHKRRAMRKFGIKSLAELLSYEKFYNEVASIPR